MIHGWADQMVAELRDRPRGTMETTTYTCCGLVFLNGKRVTPLTPCDDTLSTTPSEVTCEKCRELMAMQVDKALRAEPKRKKRAFI